MTSDDNELERKLVLSHRNILMGFDKTFQGKGLGKKLLRKVLEFAGNQGCYKTILDCSDEVMPFYLNTGFIHQTLLGKNVMRYNHED